MKAQNLPHPARHAAILPGLFLACISWSQEMPSSSLAIARTGAGNPRVTVRDAANHLWVMRTSTNLLTWTEVATW